MVEDCSSPPFSSTEPNFTLALESIVSPQMTSEPTELACRVTNVTHLPLGGRLGVDWEHSALPGNAVAPAATDGNEPVRRARYTPARVCVCVQSFQLHAGTGGEPQTPHPIGSLDGQGNLLAGSMYSDRLRSGAIALSRTQPNTFKLQFLQTQVTRMHHQWIKNDLSSFVDATNKDDKIHKANICFVLGFVFVAALENVIFFALSRCLVVVLPWKPHLKMCPRCSPNYKYINNKTKAWGGRIHTWCF